MEIVIADYDCGYERSLMINTVFYPVEEIKRNMTTIVGHCYAGRYSGLYNELFNILEILKIYPDNYYSITIVEDAHISRIYYYTPSGEDEPSKFDVIKPNFSIFDQDLVI